MEYIMKNPILFLDLLFFSLLLLLALDFTIRGFLIVSNKSKTSIFPFYIIYFFLTIVLGRERVSEMKETFQKSNRYRRYGWYSLSGGIISIVLLLVLIIDSAIY